MNIADDTTKLKGHRAAWIIHEVSCKLEAGTFVMTFSVTIEHLQLCQSNSQSMWDYLAASRAVQYCVVKCFTDRSTGVINFEKLFQFLGMCQLFRSMMHRWWIVRGYR